jgi:hypothetical protein
MAPGEIKAALLAAQTWESDIQVHLTGGEPFLNFNLLVKAVEMAAELGIPRYAETNAGWCIHHELAVERFDILRQSGLQAILISCSPFHAEKIPLKQTLIAIDSALSVFGSRNVIVYLPEWIDQISRFSIHEPVALERYSGSYGHDPAGLMFWEGYSLIPGGRAGYCLGDYTDKHPVSSFRGDHCCQEILYAQHSHFDLYGNYISGFCGGLTIGDWHELPRLLEEYRTGHYPALIDILVSDGPYGLFQMAEHRYGYKALPHGYAGKCHLCVDVRRHLSLCDQFPELQPRQFYEVLDKFGGHADRRSN